MARRNSKEREEKEFARLVINKEFATSDEVKGILKLKRELSRQGTDKSFKDLLVENNIITSAQAKRIENELSSYPPQQIPGYQVLEKIGKGAMATVYKARQLSLDRIVAIKVLPKRLSNNPEFVDRFYREGKAAAKLNHPNIVQAIDVGRAGEYHYFVMEYIDGYTVYDVLSSGKRYSEEEALDIVIGIADALSHSHRRGLIHRDVKPKNIMITKDGVPKLADMGLAREISDTRLAKLEAGKAYGTPYYISPEQVRGDVNIDFRADIYSLGATFYHMVTGRVPFNGPNPSSVMLKHIREPLTPPDHINPELSLGLAEIIEIMMAKNPQDRYQSTEELLEDLQAIRTGNPPLHAKRILDRTELVRLEREGERIENSPTIARHYKREIKLNKWKVIAVASIVLLLVSLVLNIFLFWW